MLRYAAMLLSCLVQTWFDGVRTLFVWQCIMIGSFSLRTKVFICYGDYLVKLFKKQATSAHWCLNCCTNFTTLCYRRMVSDRPIATAKLAPSISHEVQCGNLVRVLEHMYTLAAVEFSRPRNHGVSRQLWSYATILGHTLPVRRSLTVGIEWCEHIQTHCGHSSHCCC